MSLPWKMYHKLSTMFPETWAAHTPTPGDVYVIPHPRNPEAPTTVIVSKPRQRLPGKAIWAPNTRHLLLLAAGQGLQVAMVYKILVSRQQARWQAWDPSNPTIQSAGVEMDEALFAVIEQGQSIRSSKQEVVVDQPSNSQLPWKFYQKLSIMFPDAWNAHDPMPGDVYLVPTKKTPQNPSSLVVVKSNQKVASSAIWAPNTRQLLMLAASNGFQIAVMFRSSASRGQSRWQAWDPTNRDINTHSGDLDTVLVTAIEQWHIAKLNQSVDRNEAPQGFQQH